MALLLALDTSATPVSCAILRDGRVLASYYAHVGLTHSQTLMPMVEHTLRLAGITVSQLDALAVNAGPGSFTGVRIGVSAVKGLAFSNNIPCLSVSTLEAMAAPLRDLPLKGKVVALMDARCQQVYTATFAMDGGGGLSRLTPDEAISIEALKERWNDEKEPIFLVGDGSEFCYRALKQDFPQLFLASPALRYQSAAGTALVAVEMLDRGETVTAEELMPTYLRLPQAERELHSRQAAKNQ